FYNEINSATLTGAIDVIIVQQSDGSYLCSPFHVRFGKLGVLRSKEKIVDIEINGEPVDIHMKLGDTGEAFFVEEVEDEEEAVPSYLATSPLPDEVSEQFLANELQKLKISHNETGKNKAIKADYNECDANLVKNKINELQLDDKISRAANINEVKFAEVIDCDKIKTTTNICSNNNSSPQNESGIVGDLPKSNETVNRDFSRVNASENVDDKLEDNVTESTLLPEKHMISVGVQTLNYDPVYDVTDNVSGITISSSGVQQPKRRRRKKISVSKRNKNQLNNRYENSEIIHQGSNSTDANDEIFQMDDDWDDDSTLVGEQLSSSITRSSSSDTEYENLRNDATSQTDFGEVSWQWGELPQVSKKTSVSSMKKLSKENSFTLSDEENSNKFDEPNKNAKDEKKSVLGGVLSFMKSKEENTKPIKPKEDKGIYLDDLISQDIDPEVAELYFPKLRSQMPLKKPIKDDDTESGNGPSLSHSPQYMSSGPQSIDSDSDQERTTFGGRGFDLVRKRYDDFAMSLCGGLKDSSSVPANFTQCTIPYDNFSNNPMHILQNPDLVFRIGGKFYNWQTAAPIILCLVMYQRPLPDVTLYNLIEQHMPKKKQESKSSWWSWRRSNTLPPMPPNKELKDMSQMKEQGTNTNEIVKNEYILSDSNEISKSGPETENHLPIINENLVSDSEDRECKDDMTNQEENHLFPLTKWKNGQFKKSLRLSSVQIARLNLHEGANEVVFSVTTAYQGTSRCKCHIYLWQYDDKIVISDIDGTITKSDVLGHILPILGKDWAQSGVANLFTKIRSNGYKLLYLSARAIGQARTTRDYLRSVRQGDLCLPDGPLLLSPTSLISAFHREVIEKKPEEFKINCLKDIQALFPTNPFYSGFGNKINVSQNDASQEDTWAYRAVGIPLSRIFTINHRGEVTLELIQYFQSSYTRLSDVVDQMFPPIPRNSLKSEDFLSEYSSFNYWRDPIMSLPLDDSITTSNDDKSISTSAQSA
ncbi:phosphatidate phosphatase LPIN1-like protein, partial [Dinothrombium tinctorium]